ncbi:MAG: YeeE/YedE family protein [Paracoccaceae bacterium]|nr:YeeE/YedE family protein [Paracoccaceae bacterium]MDO7633604.1 YeeE/YedE family protein [Paracoccaceae bacterium]MDO7654181.1 YeeE/YedE family protein [Paracoccaceae bacterium]MDO7658645.1 YeeE/YedE family protein [Paracoccaceae bacterium]MDP5323016.1 YeeE/YedE family protein [Paracoccaceae bacterium]
MKYISSAIAGGVFGFGIAISGMANPAKVLNFFDIFGTWDPSLVFVMGGAMITALIGYRLVFGVQKRPLFEVSFSLPSAKQIDRRLILGSIVFGIGWGIAGFCPGGAIPTFGLGHSESYIFIASLVVGILVARRINPFFLAK